MFKSKITSKALLTVATLSLGSSAFAAEFGSDSSITFASQYIFRGFDMTQENPAIQGDYVINHESGFWFGAWGSTYEFTDEDGVEIDLIAGYDIALTEALTLNLGFTEYTYTGGTDSSSEFFVGLSYSNFSITYYDDVDLETIYISADASFPISEQVSIDIHAAQYEYEDDSNSSDFSVIGNYAVNEQFTIFAGFSSNDLDVTGAEDYVVAGISYSF